MKRMKKVKYAIIPCTGLSCELDHALFIYDYEDVEGCIWHNIETRVISVQYGFWKRFKNIFKREIEFQIYGYFSKNNLKKVEEYFNHFNIDFQSELEDDEFFIKTNFKWFWRKFDFIMKFRYLFSPSIVMKLDISDGLEVGKRKLNYQIYRLDI